MKDDSTGVDSSKSLKQTGAYIDLAPSLDNARLQIDYELQTALLIGMELLKILRHPLCYQGAPSQMAADITRLTVWMNFLFDQREHVANEGSEAKADAVKFLARGVCQKCRNANTEDRTNTNQDVAVPCWWRQVEFLHNCTRKLGIEMFQHCFPPSTLRGFPECLDRLGAVLRRQQQIMRSLRGGQSDVGIEFCRPDVCAKCGRMIEHKDYVP